MLFIGKDTANGYIKAVYIPRFLLGKEVEMEYIKKLAALLYDRLEQRKKKDNHILYSIAVREDLKTLYPLQDIAKKQREFVIEKLSLGILILLIGGLLTVILIIKEGKEVVIENNQLQRNPYGEGASCVSLLAKNGSEIAQISLELEERSFSQEELEDCYNSFLSELEIAILGENLSFDKVSYDLGFIDSIDGYPFAIEWQTDEEYIDSDGKLIWNELPEPVVIEVIARITCNHFERKETFQCCIRSRASPVSMQEQLQRRLQDLEKENREKEMLVLPTEYGGKDIVWAQQKEKNGFFFLLATPLVCVVLLFSKDKDLHRRVEEREEQMKIDYPELVSKLALLIGAGMTVPNAWQRMVFDYKKRKLPEEKKRYAYEEMLLTVNELKNGVYQSEALEGFGRRCRLPCYNKLATLLVQNLRSGSTNLAILLQEEAIEAFEERKHMARRQGEKAGTKLLLPMMLLLIMLMVMIIVPTFFSNMG